MAVETSSYIFCTGPDFSNLEFLLCITQIMSKKNPLQKNYIGHIALIFVNKTYKETQKIICLPWFKWYLIDQQGIIFPIFVVFTNSILDLFTMFSNKNKFYNIMKHLDKLIS